MPNLFRETQAGAPEAAAIPVGALPVPFEGVTIWLCGGQHVLFVPPSSQALVNGRMVPAGIKVLAHRDQLQTGSQVWWFSAEDPPSVAPFPGGEGGACPRCQRPIAIQAPAVRCACGNWFHQSAERACFDYAAACPVCQRPTVLGAGMDFSVEE